MKKHLMIYLAALLVLFSVPVAAMAAEDVVTDVSENESYIVALEVLKEDSDEPSATSQYMSDQAEIVVEDESTYAIVTLKQAAWWQSLKTQTTQPGTFDDTNYVEAEVLSENEEENTRVVKFLVPDLSQVLNAKIHIIAEIPGRGAYENSYDIRLKFGTEEALEDTENDNDAVNEESEEEQAPSEEESIPATLEDGKYTIEFQVLHAEEDKPSSMMRYMVTPATLTVEDGVQSVTFTLTNNEQITAFQVEVDGDFVDADVVDVDEEANTRDVAFEVVDLSATLNAKVQVYVAAQNYTGNHVVRIAFDQESIQVVRDEAEDVEEVDEVEDIITFEDIQSSWAKPYIEVLASQGIIQGVSEQNFAPNNHITRAQFTVLLARTLELPKEAYEGIFADVSEELAWAVYEVEAANRAGIVLGNNGKFNPHDPITREQMVTMVIRAIEYKNGEILEQVEQIVDFADEAEIQAYAKEAVGYAVGLGIIDGFETNGTSVFAPMEKATRAQAAKVIYEMLEVL